MPRSVAAMMPVLAIVGLALASGCPSEPFTPSQLPDGRLVGLMSDDEGTRFAWIPDTGTGKRLAWEPLKSTPSLDWPTGGSAATGSDFSVHPSTGELLFSGLLPIGDPQRHFDCRPFAVDLPTGPTGTVRVTWLEEHGSRDPEARSCGYRWYLDGMLFSRGEGHWHKTAKGETLLPFGRDEQSRGVEVHPATGRVLESHREQGLRLLDSAGKLLAKIDADVGHRTCFAPDGERLVVWDAVNGARLLTIDDAGPVVGAELPLARTPDDKVESWGQCVFSPDGSWVAFTSNRHLGDRHNPLAGVSNPKRTLHAWDPSTGKVVLVLPGEVPVASLIWLPAEASP